MFYCSYPLYCAAFAIEPTTGDIRTLLDLDREAIEFYPLTVNAEDGGTPSMSTDVSVMVTIGDVNDNDPVFTGGAVLSNDPVEVFEVSVLCTYYVHNNNNYFKICYTEFFTSTKLHNSDSF